MDIHEYSRIFTRQLKHHFFIFRMADVMDQRWRISNQAPRRFAQFGELVEIPSPAEDGAFAESWVPGIPRVRGFRDGKNMHQGLETIYLLQLWDVPFSIFFEATAVLT